MSASTRERLLGKIRRRLGVAGDDPSRKEAACARIASSAPNAPLPAMAEAPSAARVARFVEEAEKALATVSRLERLEDLPTALKSELRDRNLGPEVRMGADPALADLDWTGLDVSRGPGRVIEPATLSIALAGVAETGTLALISGPENPVTLTFLGEVHFVVLGASVVETKLEDVWTRLREGGFDPRTVNLVTGPSRTADIAQKLEIGAHGPLAVHIFLVDDA